MNKTLMYLLFNYFYYIVKFNIQTIKVCDNTFVHNIFVKVLVKSNLQKYIWNFYNTNLNLSFEYYLKFAIR